MRPATMPNQATTTVFLMKRFSIVLHVALRSNGLVKIDPYQCTDENFRLWSGIAKTQSVLAQMQLDAAKTGQQVSTLRSLFQQSGWNVNSVED